MFEGGSVVKPFPVGTVIRWHDETTGRELGRITAIRLHTYTVKNAKGELRAVNVNDHSVRLVRKDTELLSPPITDLDVLGAYQYLYALWKAK